MNRAIRLTIGLLAAAAFIPAAQGQQYQVTDLGTLGGTISQANSNNLFSQVAGFATTAGDAATHAFLWTKRHGMKDLGTLPILSCELAGNSSASAINDAGIVVGVSDYCDPVNGLVSHAFVDIRGHMNDLGTLGGSTAQANGINFWGQVVGFSFLTGDFVQHAVLWDPKGIQDIGTLVGGSNSQAFGINIWGQVVGSSDTASGSTDPFLWDSKDGMKDLGTLGGMSAQANAINFRGEVVGFSSLQGEAATHAFVYSKGKLTDIGTLGGSFAEATGIDLYGDIVGFSNTTGDADVHAFMYTSKGGLQDLNTLIPTNSGWDLNTAQSINLGDDFDQNDIRIVGTGVINGQQHAFLLTPTH